MPIDYTALQTALETDMRYDLAVRGGINRDLLNLLNEDEAGQTVDQIVTTDELLDTIGSGVRPLTVDALGTLQLYTNKDNVDLTKPSILAEILAIFTGQSAVQNRITTLSSRTRSYGEGFGETISLRDLWQVLPNISKSYMANYIARG